MTTRLTLDEHKRLNDLDMRRDQDGLTAYEYNEFNRLHKKEHEMGSDRWGTGPSVNPWPGPEPVRKVKCP